MRNQMTDTQRQIEERRRQVNDITTEQTRIRENLKTVDRNSEYSTRLLKRLNDQETTIERLQAEITTFQKQYDQQQKDFESYLQNTSVDDKD
jgi:chromosome segregation ATPase